MKTKSLSLLIALAMCITIGGVYAAWMYADTDMQAVHGHIGSIGLTNPVVNNGKGTLTVDAASVIITIDQTAADDYTANMTMTGNINFTFTPSDTFKSQHPDLNEYTMQYGLVTDNTNPAGVTYDDGDGAKSLFSTFNPDKTDITLVKDTDGNYKATVDANTALGTRLVLNTFVLNTYTKYQEFSAVLGSFGNIGIELSEKTGA